MHVHMHALTCPEHAANVGVSLIKAVVDDVLHER